MISARATHHPNYPGPAKSAQHHLTQLGNTTIKQHSLAPLTRSGNPFTSSMYSRTVIRQSRQLPHLFYQNTRPVRRVLSSYGPDHQQRGKSNSYSHHTTSGIHGRLNKITKNTPKTHSRNINMEANEEPQQIHAWLSLLEPNGRHQDVSHSRPDGFGSWVLRRNEFKRWCEGGNGTVNHTLFCYGDKGVGKSHIRYRCISQKQTIGYADKE